MEEPQPESHRDGRSWLSRKASVVDRPFFQRLIITFILINAIIVGMETYPYLHSRYGDIFHVVDRILLWVFTVEIVLRLIAIRPTRAFFKDGWNIFDFIIVASGHIFVGAYFVTVLRILRVLRLFRAISVIPSLRRLVNALLLTIPSLGNIMLLMMLIFYVFGVIGTMLYADIEPEYFGSLHLSLITLFQVVTLESWASGVMRPLLAEDPWAWSYFVSFILVGTFVIFNLFVGVIVNNVEKVDEMEAQELAAKLSEAEGDGSAKEARSRQSGLDPPTESGAENDAAPPSAEEVAALRKEMAELKEMLRMHHREANSDYGAHAASKTFFEAASTRANDRDRDNRNKT